MTDKKRGRPKAISLMPVVKSRRPRKKHLPNIGKAELAKIRNIIASGATKEGLRLYYQLSNDDFFTKFMKLPEIQEAFEKGHELRNTMIRMKQFQVAMEGNVQMLIHLGKSELGQIEKHEITGNLFHQLEINQNDEQIINDFLKRHYERNAKKEIKE